MMQSRTGTGLPIALSRASMLKPFMSFLRELGAPVAREVLNARLPEWGFEGSDVLVPTRAMTVFVANSGRSQGIDNFGLRMSQRSGIHGLKPRLRRAICSAPTLYAGLEQLCAGARHQSTRVTVWLKEGGETLYLCHRGSFPIEDKGQFEMTWWCLGTLIPVIRAFLGQHWCPERMGVPPHGDAGSLPGELFPDTELVALGPEDEMSCWIAVRRDELDTSPLDRESVDSAERLTGDEELDAVGSLRRLIRAYLPSGPPSIEWAAKASDTSRRTLQRHLAHQGTTYSRLVDEVRFELARNLLLDPDLRARDVASEAGYSDAAHFTRAFQRFVGVTPREYRRQLKQRRLVAVRRERFGRYGAPHRSSGETRS